MSAHYHLSSPFRRLQVARSRPRRYPTHLDTAEPPETVWEESGTWNPERRLGHRTTSLEAEATRRPGRDSAVSLTFLRYRTLHRNRNRGPIRSSSTSRSRSLQHNQSRPRTDRHEQRHESGGSGWQWHYPSGCPRPKL